MINVKQVVSGIILSMASLSALAVDNGFYLGAEVGYAGYVSGTGSKNSTAYGVTGGYQFDKNWGVEAEYRTLGNYSGVAVTGANAGKPFSSSSDATTIVAIGKYTVANATNVYIKLGGSNTNNNQNHANGTSGYNSRIAFTYGLGVQYDINTNISTRLGWDRVLMDGYSPTSGQNFTRNMDIWALSAIYNF